MLSAFQARPIVELKQRDKSKIESILAYGNRLLVGLNTGSLRIYRVNDYHEDTGAEDGAGGTEEGSSSQPKVKPVDLLRELEKFSRRTIEQLAIVKEANLLVSLSDGYVSIHDLQSYALQEQLVKTKGANVFAVTSNIIKDSVTGVPSIQSRLAVSVKRRLILWSWQDSELSPETVEITLPTPARTLTWATDTKIICGMNSGYVLVNVDSQEIADITGPGSIGGASGQEGGKFGGVGSAGMSYMGMSNWVPKGLATRLTEGEILLAKDINTLFIDQDGKALEKRQVPWATAPDSIGYSYPFLLALQNPAKGALEVRNPETLSLLQTISLPNAIQLHVPQPNVSLAHAGKGFLVASDRVIWRMGALQYDSQIDALVESGHLDEAISLIGLIEDTLLEGKEERLREVKMLKAQDLFDMRKYRDALDIFTEVSAPPERVIKLYPKAVAGDLSIVDGDRGTDDDLETASTKENKEPKSPPQSPKKGPALTPSKRKSRHNKTLSDAVSIMSSKRDGNDEGTKAHKHTENLGDKHFSEKDLKNAILELRGFLVDARTRMQRYLNPDGTLKPGKQADSHGQNGSAKPAFENILVAPTSAADDDREQKLRETAKLIDTTLFRCYMIASPSLAGSLFRIANFCDPDVVNEKLLEKARYNDLVDFFYGKKLHREALELLRTFGQAKEEDDTAPNLRGPERTVGYLQNLPPELIDIILEFAEWPLRQHPDLGMEVFLADTENSETLPRDKVINFLKPIDKNLAVKYLEHIIQDLNDLTPDFHNMLVNLYLDRLKRNTGENGLGPEAFKNSAERNAYRDSLLSFLRSSRQYSLAKAFGQLPRDTPEFYEPRAIVLSKMGQHKQALEIYVFNMEDHEKAEEYCNIVYKSEESPKSSPMQSRRGSTFNEDDSPPSIYHTLLSLYLAPQPPRKPDLPPALSLLSRHGSRLPAFSTLKLIPETLPVQQLESYFRGRIKAATSIVNEGRIVAGLRKTELFDSQAALLLGDGAPDLNAGRNRKVTVGEERVCGVCHKRLGRSVISVFPDNSVVHYGCSNKKQQASSAVAGRR